MGDKIEFPLNNRMYFNQAMKYIEKNDFESALECIEKVYANDKGNVVNHFYTLILYTLDRFEEALDIAEKRKDFYYQNEKHTLLYTGILIKNHLFLEAEVLIQEHIENTYSMYHSEWKNLEKELNLERELVKFKLEKEKKTIKRELIELDSFSSMQQSDIIKRADALDLKDLQQLGNIIFANPHITGMTKRAFLELLIEKEDPNEYVFPWFDQQREIVPNQLEVFDKNQIVKQLDQIIEKKMAKFPSLFGLVKVELINDLLLLYPFIGEVITDIDYWVEAYIAYFEPSKHVDIDPPSPSAKQSEMDQWIDRLNHLAQRNKPLN